MRKPERNAIIMAAGTSSRFVPLSAELPKGLLEVKGEVLIERQIRQLKEAGIDDITVVVGYKAEKFLYLVEKFGIDLVQNEDYERYNNTSSVVRVLDRLGNTFICSSDNYFPENVFSDASDKSYYSALYADGETGEYCIIADGEDNIKNVSVGGRDSWYMVGHVYFSEDFSKSFRAILAKEYNRDEVRLGYWEDVYISHISELPPMGIRRYPPHAIEEFDSLDELRTFDRSYVDDTRSFVLKDISERLCCKEKDLYMFEKMSHDGDFLLFTFRKDDERYLYCGQDDTIKKI